MTIRARILVSAGLVAVAAFGGAHAHHSVTGSFDPSKTIEITGDVVEWRFRNPHTMLIVDGTAVIDGKRDDVTRRWEIESSAAAGLRASGVDVGEPHGADDNDEHDQHLEQQDLPRDGAGVAGHDGHPHS